MQDLSSISSHSSTIAPEMPPPVPRKSSRRILRDSVHSFETTLAPTSPVQRPESPVELSSDESLESADEALERAIQELENARLHENSQQESEIPDCAPPSYSASVEIAPSQVDSSARFSQLSSTSSEMPPEYPVESPTGHPADPTNSFVMTANEKSLLRASPPDPELDAKSTRTDSVYSLHEVDPIPEQSSVVGSSVSQASKRKVLRINQRGMNTIRLPLPSNELQVHITNEDDTVAYISTRPKRSSSNCTLYQPGVGSVMQTHYDKTTTLTSLRNDGPALEPFAVTGKGFRRNQVFALPDGEGREFEWKYVTVNDAYGRRKERLVLVQKDGRTDLASERPHSVISSSYSGEEQVAVAVKLDKAKRLFPAKDKHSQRPASLRKSHCPSHSSTSSGILAAAKATNKNGKSPLAPAPRILAQLIRSEKSSRAGNGGQLVLEPGCVDLVPEDVVVSTGLVMLKKEMDRLRAVQAGVIVTILL